LLPTYSGVYLFLNKKGDVIYVGKAKNLKKRVASYFSTKDLGEKTRILVSQITKIKFIEVSSEIEAFLLEENLIKKYLPRYNIKLTDGKQYPSLKITVQDEFPKVLLVRKQVKDGSLYFGPYTSATSLRTVSIGFVFITIWGFAHVQRLRKTKTIEKQSRILLIFLTAKPKKLFKS
jgi:excinuclease ABC subunit C